ncbi:hypothetical protein IHQ56_15215 [Methylobacillus flagellatus]|uniref:hypothetical protein n=1 Tax=Methylobacillus flagellatus TaxID=405 RepID=UPI002853A2EE|nr:hypothetical protein [Methylobacillus flagellatus]MDR5172985.1 hypothetical protein [Methylobacillus flagellatus]
MQLRRVPDPSLFDDTPEWRSGLHIAVDEAGNAYIVIGGDVAVATDELGTPIEPINEVPYEEYVWLKHDAPRREELFEEWLDYLWPVRGIRPATPSELVEIEARFGLPRSGAPSTERAARTMQLLWLLLSGMASPAKDDIRELA